MFADDALIARSLSAAQADCMRLAAAGLAAEAAEMLESSPSAARMEPMVAALRMRLGEEVDVPVEVGEVAEDVVQRIDALARAGDIWRTDPHALVLPDEEEPTRSGPSLLRPVG